MKKAILAISAAALMMVVACQKEVTPVAGESNEGCLSITATMEQQTEGVKSSLSGATVSWTAGDAVRVYNEDGTASVDLTTELGDGNFTGGDLPSGVPAVCIYPADAATGYDGEKISFTLPATQIYKENSFAENANIAVASFGKTTTFYNVCGVLKLQLKGNFKVSKIVVTSKTDEQLSGSMSATVAGTESAITRTTTGATGDDLKVTLDCTHFGESEADAADGGVMLQPAVETVFAIVVPTGAFANGFVAQVYSDDVFVPGDTKISTEISTVQANLIARSTIKAMPANEILPADYQKAAYIEGTGTQFINTRLKAADYASAVIEDKNGIDVTATALTVVGEEACLLYGVSGTIASATFKDEDGKVVHRFIPAYDKDGRIGLYDIYNSGKNLFDGRVYRGGINKTIVWYENEIIKSPLLIEAIFQGPTVTVLAKSGHAYVTSGMDKDMAYQYHFWSTRTFENRFINDPNACLTHGSTFSMGSNVATQNCYAIFNACGGPYTAIWDIDSIQIEEGTVATSYEPHKFFVNRGTGDFTKGADVTR